MIPSNEMLNEWFKLNHPNGDANDFAMYWAGIAAKDPVTAAYEMVCWLLEQGLIKKG